MIWQLDIVIEIDEKSKHRINNYTSNLHLIAPLERETFLQLLNEECVDGKMLWSN